MKYQNRKINSFRIATICLAFVVLFFVGGVSPPALAQTPDPIPDYLSQVDIVRLTNVATDLVTLFGPRYPTRFSPFVDASCIESATVYPKNNL